MSAAQSVTAAAAATDDASHLFATAAGIGWHAARIAALIDPTFLAELGWDAAGLVLFPTAGHPLLGRPVCRAEGCSTTATSRARICASCRRRLAEHGLGHDELASLPARSQPTRGPDACAVDGCAREWESSRSALCRTHLDQQQALRISVEAFLGHRQARPLPPCGPCRVAACTRQRRHPDGLYCAAHQIRLRIAKDRDPGMNEERWRSIQPAIGRGGQVSLRGLPPLVVAEVLFGLQQRCRLNAVQTDEAVLRALCR